MREARRQGADARPILKWAGGKSRLLPQILARLPETIDTYYEPFLGGAAVFFSLANQRRFRKAVLTDYNHDLVDVYRALKRDVDGVIRVLSAHASRGHSRENYYRIRDLDPETLDLNERAARLIYLNKTGYNGLYRVNRRGLFNVPFGRYKNPTICDEERLRAASRCLQRVTLRVNDFEKACQEARPGDAVYLDPPYVPLSRTSSFTAYHKLEFGEEEHRRLASAFRGLARRGVRAVLSNSDTNLTRTLYRAFDCEHVQVSRPINSKTQGRGEVQELLVTNRSPARRRSR